MWHWATPAAAQQPVLVGCRRTVRRAATGGGEPDFERLRPWVSRVLALLLPCAELRLVNVNFPPDPIGLCWARQAVNTYDGHVVPGKDPMGRPHFWLSVRRMEAIEEGTD